ncbi:Putative tRNA(Ile)-lysidine synthetase [Candidatus Phycorickettsia trachydisci]|uniref:tRNA(Ile)-lysidine synthase n=1 Tax=Candidatus Phycorickettsia trachydisci TaxID=2115978 RepID=A0A2P1P7Q9_9RICK|nr:tRNA lysidine(34) synthetase TilS [Candidatus Phycorickettsia trachydisci]AVP87302.1 Putative tRNA(Ile)-lysidine synthetase [Candidatus Phycorickettsia trachydisci]
MNIKSYKKFCENIAYFNPFEKQTKIAVALSGGIDSMALTILTAKWLGEFGGNLVALTVNHNLQKTSAKDAKKVGDICAQIRIKHEILEWKHGEITSNVQSQAREARYKILTDYCKQNDILHLFVAHHLEDKVENFFIKLSRSSGIFGLIESKVMFLNNVRICRPLFNFTKKECQDVLESSNTPHIQDITNFQNKYFRNQIRFNLENFGDNFQERAAESISHLESTASLIQSEVVKSFCESVTIHKAGYAIIQDKFRNYKTEIQIHILAYLLTIISGESKPPRAIQIKQVIDDFVFQTNQTHTLNKCIIIPHLKSLVIFKEWCSIISGDLKLYNGLFWDNRFIFHTHYQNLLVSRFDENIYREVKNKINLEIANFVSKYKKRILFTLPVVKTLEKVIAIPTINYYDLSITKINCSFNPQHFSKVLHLEY